MSLNMYLGPRKDTLTLEQQDGVVVKIDSPVMNSKEMDSLKSMPGVEVATFEHTLSSDLRCSLGGLKEQLDRLTREAVEAVKERCHRY